MRFVAALSLLLGAVSCRGEAAQVETIQGQVFFTAESPGEPAPPPKLASSDYRLSGPYAHENLSVFLVHLPGAPQGGEDYQSLEEGLKAGTLRITERAQGAQVNQLEVENTGDRPVYLQAGDTVKGGKQDRTIGVDFVLPPRSGRTAVDAFCVEPGRWAARTMNDFPGVDISLSFDRSEAPVATKEQKLAIKGAQNQAQVWAAGNLANQGLANQGGLGLQRSFVLAAEDPEVQKKASDYANALGRIVEGKEDAVGMAFAVNGELSTVEIYATSGLFLKLWPKLLKGSALEALAKKAHKPAPREASAAEVAALLDLAARGEGRMRTLPGEMLLKAYSTEGAALFDTEKEGSLLHRQVIKK